MKTWLANTCLCNMRFPLSKFKPSMKPIIYPLQIVTGGGYAKGFQTVKYLPWSSLPSYFGTEVWTNILCYYNRLSAVYDHFYETLGFLSPKMRILLQAAYPLSYKPTPLENYPAIYSQTSEDQDIVKSYIDDDITDAYFASLLSASEQKV
jgi:hypothetical protein